ncbi:hypothetical protein ALT785_850046 [Alteromonas infernus]
MGAAFNVPETTESDDPVLEVFSVSEAELVFVSANTWLLNTSNREAIRPITLLERMLIRAFRFLVGNIR